MHTNKSSMAKKPFPWRCSNCREKSVREATVDYVATRVYDGIEYTVKMAGLNTPKCENCGQVRPDAEALEVIQAAFAIELQHRPFTTSLEAIDEIIAGRISMGFFNLPTVIAPIRDGVGGGGLIAAAFPTLDKEPDVTTWSVIVIAEATRA